jgi:hypothetical protein
MAVEVERIVGGFLDIEVYGVGARRLGICSHLEIFGGGRLKLGLNQDGGCYSHREECRSQKA